MNSNILNYMGLSNIDPGIYVIAIAVLLLLVLILLICTIRQGREVSVLKRRISKFMSGRDAESLEDQIVELFEDNQYMKAASDKNKNDIIDLNKRMRHCFQKVGIVKYDALNQMGGQLSYALALLDEEDNGYIINSVHGNEGCYSYTKVIKNGRSDIELGIEERKALENAVMSR
ncbi:DUF4446 family protein [Butyrivibrio sp. TB]|jgi:hypothetical protein|uniref:DUF4446 family protein n=1 Tax=Butyrivibrio sp. TB TaxID=1520809 RepID=UPI0008CD790B|nr:DUF4446 family protein [Butyrivibrio sp. TB]SEQ51537.1 Protein of unknown function [Butyrivibrio sp. TB]